MEALRDSINQLIEKTLTMEQNQEIPQDPRLQKNDRGSNKSLLSEPTLRGGKQRTVR